MHRMLLHAWRLEFAHPVSGMRMTLTARLDEVWLHVVERFGWQDAVAE
jgi:tRNA pseudouridine65 synthase